MVVFGCIWCKWCLFWFVESIFFVKIFGSISLESDQGQVEYLVAKLLTVVVYSDVVWRANDGGRFWLQEGGSWSVQFV